ncbi:hypothetical protein [Mucilaginibacter sp. OK098]|uniref:hypothetical protein n=1 Tax=Mucilaginibacter sp. OK098 TaxID=1855297 RepID=UPI00091A2B4D|nr:hypothetical protein [Mucilaginibacter sp. OK098]SHN12875.1 hypothetical protein SAMN05216524_105447 [Mucilaginibacter sp. OK098]
MKKIKDKKPFIYYENLKSWEIVSMIIYAFVTIGVILLAILGNPHNKQVIVVMYALLSQLSLYFGLYTSLRNFKSYLIWFGFGVIHVMLFLIFKDDSTLQMRRGNPAFGLANTIVLLALFQLLRYLSLKMQGREFVAPPKGGGPDLFDNKKVSSTDFIVFIIYMGSWFGLTILSASN